MSDTTATVGGNAEDLELNNDSPVPTAGTLRAAGYKVPASVPDAEIAFGFADAQVPNPSTINSEDLVR